jgi:hypothetical protein
LENFDGIEAVGVGDPADAARGEAGEAPGDAVIVDERGFFCGEKAEEFAADVAEADEREIESVNCGLLRDSASAWFGKAQASTHFPYGDKAPGYSPLLSEPFASSG